jgi:hypothetical protein
MSMEAGPKPENMNTNTNTVPPQVANDDHEDQAHGSRRYELRVDNDQFSVETALISGTDVLALARKRPCSFSLVSVLKHGGEQAVGPDDLIDLGQPGIERFITLEKDEVQVRVDDQVVTLTRGTVLVS